MLPWVGLVVEVFGSAEEIKAISKSELLIQAIDYWKSIAVNNALPKRSAIDPMANPQLLPMTFIVEIEDNDGFRFQLAGSLVEEKYQRGTLKGKTPQDLLGEEAAIKLLTPYKRVRDDAVMFYREAALEWVNVARPYTHYRVLLMPLSDDGVNVNMIYGVMDFIRIPRAH